MSLQDCFVSRMPIISISLASYTAVDAGTINIPTDVQDGDLGIFWDAMVAGSNLTSPENITVNGWEKVINEYMVGSSLTGGNGHQQVFMRIMQSDDAGDTIYGTNFNTLTGIRRKMVAIFRPNRKLRFISFQGYVYSQTQGDPVAQSIPAASIDNPMLVLGFYRAGAAISGASFSPTQDGSITPSTAFQLRYKQFISNSQNVAIDMADSSNYQYLGGCGIHLQ